MCNGLNPHYGINIFEMKAVKTINMGGNDALAHQLWSQV